jgi:hypothetical protein
MYGLIAKTLLLFHLLYLPAFDRTLSAIFLQYFFSTFLYFLYYNGQLTKRKWFNGNDVYIILHNIVITALYTYMYIEIHSFNTWIKINTIVYLMGLPFDLYHTFSRWFKENFVIELADDRVYQHVY